VVFLGLMAFMPVYRFVIMGGVWLLSRFLFEINMISETTEYVTRKIWKL
jgi:hypothetical protein